MRTSSFLPGIKFGVMVMTLVGALFIGLGPVSSATDDNEKISLSMATMLRSARAVISDK